ncbi:MAG: helix-turn-helix domain-containing protein, partial [Bacteroides sp.]
MALIWNVTERTITKFCKAGRIPGAIKVGKSWQIPENAE